MLSSFKAAAAGAVLDSPSPTAQVLDPGTYTLRRIFSLIPKFDLDSGETATLLSSIAYQTRSPIALMAHAIKFLPVPSIIWSIATFHLAFGPKNPTDDLCKSATDRTFAMDTAKHLRVLIDKYARASGKTAPQSARTMYSMTLPLQMFLLAKAHPLATFEELCDMRIGLFTMMPLTHPNYEAILTKNVATLESFTANRRNADRNAFRAANARFMSTIRNNDVVDAIFAWVKSENPDTSRFAEGVNTANFKSFDLVSAVVPLCPFTMEADRPAVAASIAGPAGAPRRNFTVYRVIVSGMSTATPDLYASGDDIVLMGEAGIRLFPSSDPKKWVLVAGSQPLVDINTVPGYVNVKASL